MAPLIEARKIIHIDMDAFYASVEQRDFPEYRNRPIAVGGSPEGRGGVVATASYEARKFGIHSAMSSKTAQRLCPELTFVSPRFEAYKKVSVQIRQIFQRYTDLIEPLSLDEAYLDVTVDKQGIGSAIDIARGIKQAIKDELNLTASAGVSVNKFIAKTASDMNKPDGLTFIGPSKTVAFMENLAVEKFFGVGAVTAARMKALGLFSGADIKKLSEEELVSHFGKHGKFLFQIVRGIDERRVVVNRERKSLSVEDTYPFDLTSREQIELELKILSERLSNRLKRSHLKGKTVTLKLKFHDFVINTRSFSLQYFINDQDSIFQTTKSLLNTFQLRDARIRLIGLGMSRFEPVTDNTLKEHVIQLELF